MAEQHYTRAQLRDLLVEFYSRVDPARLDAGIDINGMVDWVLCAARLAPYSPRPVTDATPATYAAPGNGPAPRTDARPRTASTTSTCGWWPSTGRG